MSDWTLDTLRAHFEALLGAHEAIDVQRLRMAEQETQQAVNASKNAVMKAEQASITFLPRAEFDVQLHAISGRLIALEKKQMVMSGTRVGSQVTWAFVVAAIGIVFGLIGVIGVVIAATK